MVRVKGRIKDSTALDALRTGATIRARSVIVVAHPDDETISIGGCLPRLTDLTLVQLTNGSPGALDDAHQACHATREAYAATREHEAVQAMRHLGVAPHRRICYGLCDQGAVNQLAWLIKALAHLLQSADLVIAHPYEGGHPDHDTAACAVQIVCDCIAQAGGSPPLRLEFASYHARGSERRTGRFWPDPDCPEVVVRLTGQSLARKRDALRCYRSQAAVIDWFDPGVERYRSAPRYDFSHPPPPGVSLYDSFGWTLTSAEWRSVTRMALAQFTTESVSCG